MFNINKGKTMSNNNNTRLLSWMVSRPIIFALIAFVAMTAATAIAGMIGMSGMFANALGVIALLGATTWLVRKLPAGNLDRHSFVFITNAQTIVTSIAFIASTIFIFYNSNAIMLRMFWMETHSTPSFVAILVTAALFYLYLFGIFIGNLYAKYRRIRTMGVGMWKTLATAPFGFCMLWIPGYLMEENAPKKPDPEIDHGWFSRLTDWIISRPSHAAGALVALIIMSGFAFGFNAILLNLGLGALFAVWYAIVGAKKMRDSLGGVYSTTAIVINILTIIGLALYTFTRFVASFAD